MACYEYCIQFEKNVLEAAAAWNHEGKYANTLRSKENGERKQDEL